MYTASDVPVLVTPTEAGARQWWTEFFKLGLSYHPDDDPADLVWLASGERALDVAACARVRADVEAMFKHLGDETYRVGNDALWRSMGVTPPGEPA
jgi:hypothetical protein